MPEAATKKCSTKELLCICGWNPWTLLKFNFFTDIFRNFWLRVQNNYDEEQHFAVYLFARAPLNGCFWNVFFYSCSKYFSELYCKSISAPPFNKKLYHKQTCLLLAVFSSGSLWIFWKLTNTFLRTGLDKHGNLNSVTLITHFSPINKGIIGKSYYFLKNISVQKISHVTKLAEKIKYWMHIKILFCNNKSNQLKRN